MTWTTLYFSHKEKTWRDRAEWAEKNQKPGHKAYALRQAEMWDEFRIQSADTFVKVLEEAP